MLQPSVVVFVALAYIGLLFAVASFGDRRRAAHKQRAPRPLIYSLSLAIYCTSWTFFGSVGLASLQGFDFLTIYLVPILLMLVASPVLMRIVTIAKAQNITSIADFLAARYGKSQKIAALVTVVAVTGSVPYISLQLKAVSAALMTVMGPGGVGARAGAISGELALIVALAMAAFAVLFGTRHADATEHQDGLMLAVATESIVKLVAFLAIGIFATFFLFDGPSALFHKASESGALLPFQQGSSLENWVTMAILSAGAFILLPRQFHVAVVENKGPQEIARARWLFPLYLVLMNLFVVPVALAGMILFPLQDVDRDVFVLAVPLAAGSQGLALLAFIGGLSAASAMVIVESVALAIMVSNDLVVPLLLRRRAGHGAIGDARQDMTGRLLLVRRIVIFVILLLVYFYFRTSGDVQLAQIGLLSFAAIVQVGPAFVAGLTWRRATAQGAGWAIVVGLGAWAYTLLVPTLVDAGFLARALVENGPFGLGVLRPTALLGLTAEPLTHGVAVSLGLNTLVLVAASLMRQPSSIEQVQAGLFIAAHQPAFRPSFRRWRSAVTVDELKTTVSCYLGVTRTRAAFEAFARERGGKLDPDQEASAEWVGYAERLMASAIGAASSRMVLSLLLRKRTVSTKAALKLLDEASSAIQYSRDLLQNAIDHLSQAIAVFDRDLRLVCWNRQFGTMLDLPAECHAVGVPLRDILSHVPPDNPLEEAGQGGLDTRLARYAWPGERCPERLRRGAMIVKARSDPMPDGGIVVSFTDISASVEAEMALERANETLERRVRERTEQLERLNEDLEKARSAADDANLSKTRFLAAASHDILQPLNAARLYVTSLVERARGPDEARLAVNIEASLEAVEEIFSAVLDMSRLDSGAMRPEISPFDLGEVLRQLELEFAPLAAEKHLRLTFVPTSLTVRSDRRLLRRLLQNLISNAIKYTPSGRVLVGCRRYRGRVRLVVTDTGMGIPRSKHKLVFQEFLRLDQGAREARGLGLGLSIVERIARVLDHPVSLSSALGKGSTFTVDLPVTAPLPAVRTPPVRPDQALASLEGLGVLVIDNEAPILDGMDLLLSGWGCRVVTASDPSSAVREVQARAAYPDIILIDYHLDGGHGIEAVMGLRWKLGRLPAVLITADRSGKVRAAAAAADMMVLHKPIKPAALRAILAHWRMAQGVVQ